LRSEAAFARLAGAPPIPASSGKTVRHRLDRGGDRRLNRALHTIVLTRRRGDAATIAYIARRVSEQVRAGRRSLPQALPCAPALPVAGDDSYDCLTNIEASPFASGTAALLGDSGRRRSCSCSPRSF
jgi:hypothetical protein